MVGDGLWHRVYHTSIYRWVHDWNPNQADFEETVKTPNFPSNFSNWWNQTHLFPSWAVAAIYSCASKYSMIFSIIDWWVYPHAVFFYHMISPLKSHPHGNHMISPFHPRPQEKMENCAASMKRALVACQSAGLTEVGPKNRALGTVDLGNWQINTWVH